MPVTSRQKAEKPSEPTKEGEADGERRKSSDGFGLRKKSGELLPGESPARSIGFLTVIAMLLCGGLLSLMFAWHLASGKPRFNSNARQSATMLRDVEIHVCGGGYEDANGAYQAGGYANGALFYTKDTRHENDHRYVLHMHQDPGDTSKLWHHVRLNRP